MPVPGASAFVLVAVIRMDGRDLLASDDEAQYASLRPPLLLSRELARDAQRR